MVFKSYINLFAFPKRCICYLWAVKREKKPVIFEEVCIENYAAEGKSLARLNGKVIFIENTVPGDVVDVQLFKNKKIGLRAFLCVSIHFPRKELHLFVSILGYAAAANGKCCLMKNNLLINKSR